MTTYTPENASSIDEVKVYSDAGLTTLVETLTVTALGSGEYEFSQLTYSLYNLGQKYYLKVTYTPSGASQRYQSIAFYVAPSVQGNAAATETDTDCDGKRLEAPVILFRLGLGAFREEDFSNGIQASRDRTTVALPLPDETEAEELHLLLSAAKAGAPLALEKITGLAERRDKIGIGGPEIAGRTILELLPPIQPGAGGGYRGGLSSPKHYLKLSRNITVHPDLHRTRPGWSVRRSLTGTTIPYIERIPVDRSNGAFKAALFVTDTFYTDASSPSAITGAGTLTEPYGAATNRIPKWVWMLGRVVWVNGTDANFRVVIWTGTGDPKVKSKLEQPGDPTLTAQSGGNMTQGDVPLRIEFRDSDTDTRSGPNRRTSAAQTVTLSSGNKAVKVDAPAFPARASHWRIQTAKSLVDSPPDYEVHESAKSSVGGTVISDAEGWIPVANTTAYIDADPASGDRFPYRFASGFHVYRHSTPPTAASMVVQYANRAFYSSHADTWLVFSEPGNPEHFYNDPTSPHEGFNTFRGEGLMDTIPGPCRALGATDDFVFFFVERGIVAFWGSFVLPVNEDGSVSGDRDVRSAQLAENTLGALCPDVRVVDHDLFFVSPDGPSVLSNGRAVVLDPAAVRGDWSCRNPVYDHRIRIGYDPHSDCVLYTFCSKDTTLPAGVPNVTLAWHRGKQQWCPPWDLPAISWTLHRDQDDSGNEKGVRLFFGAPYQVLGEFGIGHGDGEDGSSAETQDTVATSATTTSATVSGKTWTTDQWKGRTLVLTDRTTGQRHVKWIKTNSGTVLTWEGSLSDSGGGWLLNIAGIRTQIHLAFLSHGAPLAVRTLFACIQDLLSVLS